MMGLRHEQAERTRSVRSDWNTRREVVTTSQLGAVKRTKLVSAGSIKHAGLFEASDMLWQQQHNVQE